MPRSPLAAAALAGVLAATCLLVVSVVAPGLWTTGARGASPASARVVPTPPRPGPPSLRAVRVLEEWRGLRARAYARADVAALRRIYVPGSRAGRRDCAILRAYADRGVGLRLRTRTEGLSVLVARPRQVVLRQRAAVHVTARLGDEERALPSPGTTWRRVALRLVDGRWLLSAAGPVTPGSPREPP